jgi:hypothetical protein
MAFQKAVKSQSLLRSAFFGPAGAGKTYSALAVASGMGGKVALIDSERGSASKYADRFDFDADNLVKKTIDEYVEKIGEAGKAGYHVLIIDSLTHAWQELLEEIDKLANAKYKGNSWGAWSEGTPKQKKLVNAILAYPGHVIVTMRSKTEWTTVKGNDGKDRPARVGLAPEQGKGIEYEFDLLLELSTDHLANVIKDRTGKFQDSIIEKPGKKFGAELIEWLNSGEKIDPKVAAWNEWKENEYPAIRDGIKENLRILAYSKIDRKAIGDRMAAMIEAMDSKSLNELDKELAEKASAMLAEATKEPEQPAETLGATGKPLFLNDEGDPLFGDQEQEA